MDEQKITTVYDVNSWDKHFPKPLQVMVDKIDLESGIEFYSEIKDRVYTIMNDYTHTGANQIARNFAELDASIESNFSDELILDTLQGNRTLLKTTMIVFLESIGLKNKFISESEIKEYLDY